MPTHPSLPFSYAYTRKHHQPDSSPPGLAQWACYIKTSAYGSRVGWTSARTIHIHITCHLKSLVLLHYLAKQGNTKITFSLKCCILVESAAAGGLCCTHKAPVCCRLFLKEKLSSVMCLIVSTFVEIVRYPINTVHWLSVRPDEEQLPSFAQRPTPWQISLTYSMWVTDSRIVGPVWCIQLIVLTLKNGSAVTRWYFNVFRVFLVKSMQTAEFKWKDAIFGFPVSSGSAEAQVRYGGKIKYILVAYFLCNTCAKNYCNRTVCQDYSKSKVQRWDVFLRCGVCT